MHGKSLFEYAIVRLVPCVDRQEFLNVGVILYRPDEKEILTAFELNESRALALCSTVRLDEIRGHLDAFAAIAAGREGSGPIGSLPPGERFRWLTAPRSTVVQTSPVHTGLCTDASATIESLLEKMVR